MSPSRSVSPGEMVDFTARARASGTHRFQLKIGGVPREDAERVRAVVEATDDEDVIVADANGGWRLQDATIAVRMLEELPRVRLEQPCPTIEECLVPAGPDLDAIRARRGHHRRRVPDPLPAGRGDGCGQFEDQQGRGPGQARTIRELAETLGLRLTIEDTWGGDLVTAASASWPRAPRPKRSMPHRS